MSPAKPVVQPAEVNWYSRTVSSKPDERQAHLNVRAYAPKGVYTQDQDQCSSPASAFIVRSGAPKISN